MTAPPARSSLFPAGTLAPATAKTLWGTFYDYVTGLLPASGSVTAGSILVSSGAGLVEVPDDHAPVNTNGGFEINQRVNVTSPADDAYCLDRFYVLTESGTVTTAQTTDPEAGAPWGIRLTQPDVGAKRMGLATILESKDCRKLRSAVATLAARVKLSTGGTLRYAIIEHTGTADAVTSDVVNSWASATFTPTNFFIAGVNVLQCGTITPGAATWGDLAGYGTVGASMNNLVCFIWTEAQAAQNVTLDINRFRCVPGTIALPHRFRPNELALCQRHYWRRNWTTGHYIGSAGQAYSASSAFGMRISAPVSMRATPTVINSSALGAFSLGSAVSAMAAVVTNFNLGASGLDGDVVVTQADRTGNGLVAGDACVLSTTSSVFIDAAADL
jgi:hypothetical protein